MGSQPSQQVQNTSSTSTSGPPQAIEGMLKNLANQTFGQFLNNPTAPGYFPNGTVAPQSPETIAAIKARTDRAKTGLGFGLDAGARQLAADTIGGDYLNLDKHPYFQSAITASLRAPTENFAKNIIPTLRSTFAGVGRSGSGSESEMLQQAFTNFDRSVADATAKVGADAYNQERGRQMSAIGLLPSFQAMDYADIDALGQAGQIADAYAQRQLDDENAKYRYDQTAQLDWLTQMAQRLQGIYPGGTTSGSGTTMGSSTPASDGFSTALGAIAKFLPMLPGFSDRRAKTDIEPLGIDPLTGLPLYAYRYKRDPKTYPKVVGPMAQDIEEAMPNTVREIAGRKIVHPAAMPIPARGLM